MRWAVDRSRVQIAAASPYIVSFAIRIASSMSVNGMTDTFISIVGDVARPYTYCIIEETPVYEWSIGGVPLPDLPFLYGPDYAEMHRKANELMKSFVESQGAAPSSDPDPAGGSDPESQNAQKVWIGQNIFGNKEDT